MYLKVVPIWAGIPFVAFLLCIAAMPLINSKWWSKYFSFISVPLGIVVIVLYYAVFQNDLRIQHTALEYFSFIVLLGSLFVVTGGILIRIEGRANPILNAMILFVGAVLANIIGTTGSSMLLIRPYLHLNQARLKGYLVVFFIFIVSNIGGALTPIGDPPLFLGYLKGVPFFWVIGNLWHIWIFAVLATLAVFVAFDYYHHRGIESLEVAAKKSRVILKGWYNFIFLAVILYSVFLWAPWRELLMLAAALASYFLTPRAIHREHHFTFGPIREVAILFFGIFATMMPALDWLEANAGDLGLATPSAYYWASGALSSFLDNAPTYLSFLSAAKGLMNADVPLLVLQAPAFIIAISVASVFFGACTYIGNGPNFMVKAIADHRGVHCPSFVGYIFKYSLPILLPIFFLVWLIFIR